MSEFNYFNDDSAPRTSPELLAAIERARNHKMTPQETFEQRVSFVSEGRDKDEVRKRLIEQCGYPAEASERAAIVAWLRSVAKTQRQAARQASFHVGDTGIRLLHEHQAQAYDIAAGEIERGAHLKP